MIGLGACLYAFGINQLQVLNYGMGSFDTLTLQISKLTIIKQFGNVSFLIHFIFFLILYLLHKRYKIDKKMIVLSIISVFILTRVVNLFANFNYYQEQNIFVFIITFLVLNLGLYLLAKSNFIIAPFDKFLIETANYSQINFGIIRLIADVSLLFIAMIINYIFNQVVPITIFTLIMSFLTGINIALYEIIFKQFERKQ